MIKPRLTCKDGIYTCKRPGVEATGSNPIEAQRNMWALYYAHITRSRLLIGRGSLTTYDNYPKGITIRE